MSFDLTTYKAPKAEKKDFRIETGSFQLSKKLSDKKKEIFYRELGMLLRSGVDFKKALEILGNQSSNKFEKELILQIKEKVVEGRSIYESMHESNQFSPYEYYSIQIGEETRKLEEVLGELQKYFNRKIQMKRQIISVMTYPTIVMLVTVLVLYFMLNKVVPMFSSVFKQFGSELPKSTQIILKISNHSGMIFSVVIGIIVGLIAIHMLLKEKDGYRSFTTRLILKIPYFGNLIRKIYISRFCQAMLVGFLTSLLISYFLIQYYGTKNSELNLQTVYSNQSYQLILDLEAQKEKKLSILKESGVLSSKFLSYYGYQLIKSIPSNISLNELNIIPLKEEYKENKKAFFENRTIVIKGETFQEASFNNWLEGLKKMDWLQRFEIISLKKDKKNKSIFEIKITLKNV